MRNLLFLSIFSSLIFSSCLKEDEIITQEREAFNKDVQTISDLNESENLGLTQTEVGYFYKVTEENSTGRTFDKNLAVRAAYTISKLDGTAVFEKTVADSVIFTVYSAPEELFEGYVYPLYNLKEGESGVYYFPSTLVYGNSPKGTFSNYEPVKLEVSNLQFYDEDEQINKYFSDNGITNAEKQESGIYLLKTLDVTEADSLKTGQIMSIDYKGTFLDGDEFDSGSLSHTVGTAQYIPGFVEAIELLKKGEKGTVFIPSDQAYAENGSGSIPPYTPIIFEIEVTEVSD